MRIFTILAASLMAIGCASTTPSPSTNIASFGRQSVNEDKCIEKNSTSDTVTTCPIQLKLDGNRPEAFDAPYYCKVKFDISTDGKTKNVSIISSTGYKNLGRLCVNSVAHWLFTPPKTNGGEVVEANSLLANVQFIHDKDYSKKGRVFLTPYWVYINFKPVPDRLQAPEDYYKAIRIKFPKPKPGNMGT